jgi:hypothetical protein
LLQELGWEFRRGVNTLIDNLWGNLKGNLFPIHSK